MRGDKGIDYGRVMAVVSAINRAGFSKVALLTECRGRKKPGRPRAAAAAGTLASRLGC